MSERVGCPVATTKNPKAARTSCYRVSRLRRCDFYIITRVFHARECWHGANQAATIESHPRPGSIRGSQAWYGIKILTENVGNDLGFCFQQAIPNPPTRPP